MDVDTSKINCNKLIEMFDALKITNEEMSLFAGYGDSGNPFNNDLKTAKQKLETVTSYIEGTSTGVSKQCFEFFFCFCFLCEVTQIRKIKEKIQ